MSAPPKNQAAWLDKAGTPPRVGEAPIPVDRPGEIVIKNTAIAINLLDWHMQDHGVFVQQWPTILGCDVAGEVFEVRPEVLEVGPEVQRFKTGDRVIGHTINLVTGRPQDGAFALYVVVRADKADVLPDKISFTDGVEAGEALPGIPTPALGLPYPVLQDKAPSISKVLVVYGGSSSTGSMVTQIATVAGVHVIAITGPRNFDLSKRCGAAKVFDHKDPSIIDKVVEAVKKSGCDFVGIFDAISAPEPYANDLAILAQLGGGHLACTHPPPTEVPNNVKTGMIYAVNDVATPVWRDYVTGTLDAGKLKCLLPPTIVGKGLEYVQEALKMSKTGVSATKLVVEL
ncbi:putative zinc-binding alcohol dehydrogenase domain-containing protein cipB [Setomelanomma holmii]|uniref:Zinc-binding alcohol dehydrogenase domain-containing protein cipB n=1 Tax=Setomelanomma holmii TaxID=210430 RepID=A0A9P4H0P6_9PLEO|nr:putative zinc-binding alcohol dehydrogenase domain-containing protein cipB [Setomelanomma holmii]